LGVGEVLIQRLDLFGERLIWPLAWISPTTPRRAPLWKARPLLECWGFGGCERSQEASPRPRGRETGSGGGSLVLAYRGVRASIVVASDRGRPSG